MILYTQRKILEYLLYRYGIRDNELGAVVTSYKGHSNGNDFIEVLNQSYKKILPIISN